MSKATDISDAIIKAAIFDIGLKAVETAAIADSPWLGLPVFRQIFELLLNTIGNKIYDVLSNSLDFEIIKIQTEQERAAYDSAVSALQTTVQKPGATQDEIDKAKAELRARLAALIKFH